MYKRNGTPRHSAGSKRKPGSTLPRVNANRSWPEFADHLLEIAAGIRRPADPIHLVMEDLLSRAKNW